MRSKLILMSLLGLVLSWTGAAHAFCVYNDTTNRVDVVQLYHWHGMSKQVSAATRPGGFVEKMSKLMPNYDPNAAPVPGSACCSWQNKDCNESGKQDAVLSMQVYVTVKSGNAVGYGREGYLCGQIDGNDNMGVPFYAGGHMVVSHNTNFKPNKPVAANNPKNVVYVYDPAGRHVKTYPCPGAPRKATWSDLIPDWSDVIAG